jgi:S-adenosylmethionine decarboxylase proenzyme
MDNGRQGSRSTPRDPPRSQDGERGQRCKGDEGDTAAEGLQPEPMRGLHLTADLHGCASGGAPLGDPEALRALCLHAVAASGLHAVGELFHRFPAPGGVTGVVLLAESHLAVHTWPELAAVTLDVYVCNLLGDNGPAAEALLAALLPAFQAQRVERRRLLRGELGEITPPAAK